MTCEDIMDERGVFILKIKSKICIHWTNENSHDVALASLHEDNYECHVRHHKGGQYLVEHVTCTDIKTCSFTCFYISTRDRYILMLRNYVYTKLHQWNVINGIAWMSASASSLVATYVRQMLQQHFVATVISRKFVVSLPPQTQDIIPMDF